MQKLNVVQLKNVMILLQFFMAALVAVGFAHPGVIAPLIGTHSTSYNAHAINHAYGVPAAIAAPVSAYPYSYPGFYNQLIAVRR